MWSLQPIVVNGALPFKFVTYIGIEPILLCKSEIGPISFYT